MKPPKKGRNLMGRSDTNRGPKGHALKTITGYYKDTATGRKSFEVRENDRGFAEGDVLYLCEWDHTHEVFTGEFSTHLVTYIMTMQPHLKVGYVAMGIAPIGLHTARSLVGDQAFSGFTDDMRGILEG